MSAQAGFNSTDVVDWERVDPPLWWAAAGRFVVADRHLPDGTRQHMVQGHMEPGVVVANAQVIGQDDVPDAAFSATPSHLSRDAADDIMGNTNFGRAALRKLGPVPANFRIYSAGWIEKQAKDWRSMKVAGAEFRVAKRGKNVGKLVVLLPGTVRTVVVTKEEIQAEDMAKA